MSARYAKFLEQYAALFDMTSGEVMEHMLRFSLAQQRMICGKVDQIMEVNEIPRDHRLEKVCFGVACVCCKYRRRCLENDYTGEYVWNRESIGEFVFTPGAEPPEWLLKGIEESKK